MVGAFVCDALKVLITLIDFELTTFDTTDIVTRAKTAGMLRLTAAATIQTGFAVKCSC